MHLDYEGSLIQTMHTVGYRTLLVSSPGHSFASQKIPPNTSPCPPAFLSFTMMHVVKINYQQWKIYYHQHIQPLFVSQLCIPVISPYGYKLLRSYPLTRLYKPRDYERHFTVNNRPFATTDNMVQNPPYWRASSLLFLHRGVKGRRGGLMVSALVSGSSGGNTAMD